jgi:hypothetical protein
MDVTCWFCCRSIFPGERANRFPPTGLAVHTVCLRLDAVADGARPGEDDLPVAA